MLSSNAAAQPAKYEVPKELQGLINLLADWLADEFLRENNMI